MTKKPIFVSRHLIPYKVWNITGHRYRVFSVLLCTMVVLRVPFFSIVLLWSLSLLWAERINNRLSRFSVFSKIYFFLSSRKQKRLFQSHYIKKKNLYFEDFLYQYFCKSYILTMSVEQLGYLLWKSCSVIKFSDELCACMLFPCKMKTVRMNFFKEKGKVEHSLIVKRELWFLLIWFISFFHSILEMTMMCSSNQKIHSFLFLRTETGDTEVAKLFNLMSSHSHFFPSSISTFTHFCLSWLTNWANKSTTLLIGSIIQS